MIQTLPLIALGGALGACLRYVTGLAATRAFGAGFPWGTVIVNIAGGLAMGFAAQLLADRTGSRLQPFVMTGILGGFTTFSAFSLDTVQLWQRGDTLQAAAYMLVSNAGAIGALVLGLALARAVTA